MREGEGAGSAVEVENLEWSNVQVPQMKDLIKKNNKMLFRAKC